MAVRNNKKNTRAGLRYVFLYRRDSNGDFVGIDGTEPTNGDQNGTGGGFLVEMPQSLPISNPTPDDIVIDAESGPVRMNDLIGPQQTLTAEMTIGSWDLDLQAYMQGTNAVDKGAGTFGAGLPQNPEIPAMMIIEQNVAKVRGGASDGQPEKNGNIILNATMTWLASADAPNLRSAHINRWSINADPYGFDPTGASFTSATDGTCSMVYRPFNGPYWLDYAAYRGDAAETEFFLPRSVPTDITVSDIVVSVDGEIQTPTTDYTLDTATDKVTFQGGAVPGTDAVIVVLYWWTDEC
jgi:hypothetical protein